MLGLTTFRGGVWVIPAMLAVVVAGGCASADRGTAAAKEASVRPGINDPYFEDPSVKKWAQRFEVESREVYVQRGAIVAAMGLKPGMEVADIGAGTGVFTWILAEEVGTTGRVYAVDIIPEFVKHVGKEAGHRGMPQVQGVLCSDDDVELAPGTIDAALIVDTYHHFEHPLSTMRSLHRALRPGGEVTVVDFRRVEGESRAWVMEHVRAGRETAIAEIESAGFTCIDDGSKSGYLKENYLIRFRRE